MSDGATEVACDVLDLRAWSIHGERRILIAERMRRADGTLLVIWHVPAVEVRGVLWLEEIADGTDQESLDSDRLDLGTTHSQVRPRM